MKRKQIEAERGQVSSMSLIHEEEIKELLNGTSMGEFKRRENLQSFRIDPWILKRVSKFIQL